MKKLSLTLSFFLMFAVPLCLADYNNTGGLHDYFMTGDSIFNTDLTGYDAYSVAIASPKNVPLVNDLDNDGIPEIIVQDNSNIRLYHDNTALNRLDVVDSYLLSGQSYVSNMIIYDIDNDGYDEIIVGDVTPEINILEYNGTIISNTVLDIDEYYVNGEFLIDCKGTDDCLAMVITAESYNSNKVNLTAYPFDSTQVYAGTNMNSGVGMYVECFPHPSTMSIADYDNDGVDEYIFSEIGIESVAKIAVYAVNVTSNVAYQENVLTRDTTINLGGTSAACSNGVGTYVTSPLVMDIDNSISNGLEIVYAIMIDTDSFKMYSHRSDFNFLDDYPEITDGEGRIISNVMKADAFYESGSCDFCVLGFDSSLYILNVLCASECAGTIPETRSYTFDIGQLNFTQDRTYDIYNTIAHSGQTYSYAVDGHDLTEIISSFGSFWLGDCNILGYCDISLAFENPVKDGAVVPVDAQNTGYDDWLILTDTNLWYIDDKYTNQGGQIARIVFEPCTDQGSLQLNTTMTLDITTYDTESDTVSVNVIMYYGNPNQYESGFTENFSSGAVITISDLPINSTVSSGVIRVQARDTGNPSDIQSINYPFSVSTTGHYYGDGCIYDTGNLIVAETPNGTAIEGEEYTLEDNELRTAAIDTANMMGIPVLLLILIVMGGIDLIIIMCFVRHPFMGVIIDILADIFILMICLFMGLIVETLVISLFAIMVIAFGFWLASMFNKAHLGGGA